MFVGVVLTNVAVQQMRRALNQHRLPEEQLRWHDAVQYVAQRVIDEYRRTQPEGPLYRKLRAGYWIAGVGGFVMIGSAFALKFT